MGPNVFAYTFGDGRDEVVLIAYLSSRAHMYKCPQNLGVSSFAHL